MLQKKSMVETNSIHKEAQKFGGLLKKLFTPEGFNDDVSALSEHIDDLNDMVNKTTTYLGHLLKDNTFMYKLSAEDVAPILGDIEYIKLRSEIELNELVIKPSDNGTKSFIHKIKVIRNSSNEVISKYVESVESLTKLTNKKYEKINNSTRNIKEYGFIELVVFLSKKNKQANKSKKECINSLKLSVGDNFGYPLRLDIQRPTVPNSVLYVSSSIDKLEHHIFFYSINYSMILRGQLLPDKNHIKEQFFNTEREDFSIDIINDPSKALGKLLPCTNILKRELLISIRFIENIEKFIDSSITAYQEEANGERNLDQLIIDINKKVNNLSLILEKQTERTDLMGEGHWVEFPEVSSENYVAIHSLINHRIMIIKSQLEVLKEISRREFVSIPQFNLDIMAWLL